MLRGESRTSSAPASAATGDFTRLLMRAGHPVRVMDLASDGRFTPQEHCSGVDAGPALFVPLRMREFAPGYLAVYRKRGAARSFACRSPHRWSCCSAWASVALENLRLAENVERLAVTDDLTQVYNYRFLKTALRREIKRAGRFRQTCRWS